MSAVYKPFNLQYSIIAAQTNQNKCLWIITFTIFSNDKFPLFYLILKRGLENLLRKELHLVRWAQSYIWHGREIQICVEGPERLSRSWKGGMCWGWSICFSASNSALQCWGWNSAYLISALSPGSLLVSVNRGSWGWQKDWRREKIVVPSDCSLSLSISLQQLLFNYSSVGTAVGSYLQFFPYPKTSLAVPGRQQRLPGSGPEFSGLLLQDPNIHSFFLQLLFLCSLWIFQFSNN